MERRRQEAYADAAASLEGRKACRRPAHSKPLGFYRRHKPATAAIGNGRLDNPVGRLRVVEDHVDIHHMRKLRQLGTPAMATGEADVILGGRDELQVLSGSTLEQVGYFVVGQMMVVGKPLAVDNDGTHSFQGAIELRRIGNACIGQYRLPLQGVLLRRQNLSDHDGLAAAGRLADQLVGGVSLADLQDGVEMAHLYADRCAHRA